jgi:hypothetical protein
MRVKRPEPGVKVLAGELVGGDDLVMGVHPFQEAPYPPGVVLIRALAVVERPVVFDEVGK